MKKLTRTSVAAATALLTMSMPLFALAEETKMEFTEEALMLAAVGDTYDVMEILEMGEEQEVLFSTYDETVAEVDEEGVITATGYGITTIVASLASDETVSASMDVAVFDYCGTYYGEKTIEAMGCDISIEMILNEDGTYSYYRAPMLIDMEGGGEMPELEDEGTYEVSGTEFTFISEELGEFTASFQMDEETAWLEGKLPTGGPNTEMTLEKEIEEEETETDTETETETEEASE